MPLQLTTRFRSSADEGNRDTLDRLFSEKSSSVTLQLLEQAALALCCKLKVELA